MAISNPTEALRIVFACAALYEKNLSGNNVLFATVDKAESACVETLFQPQNFLHLTGLQTELSSERFYDAALNKRLKLSDISFKTSGATELKLQILPKLMAIHLTARMIGDYNHSQPLLITDKFAGTVVMAMGFTFVNGVCIHSDAIYPGFVNFRLKRLSVPRSMYSRKDKPVMTADSQYTQAKSI